MKALEISREEPIQRERILKDVLRRLEKRLSTARFDIDVEAYKDEINRLLKKCEFLRKKEEDYKNKLVELETERIRLEAQREIIDLARRELFADYKFADKLTGEYVDCPTCGASYTNSFAERFNIACDEDRCVNLLQQIRQGIDDINEQIKKHKDGLSDTNLELDQVNELLAAKQGEVTLKDLIENEGKREVSTTLNLDLAEVRDQIAIIDVRLRGLGNELKKITDQAHTQQIKNLYRELMHRNLGLLNVTSYDEAAFRNIECSIKETGSDLPRAILAYVFSILHVIKRFGSSAFCPIVIDAPNQQEQDQINHPKMLKFTRDNLPGDAQLILGLVDDCGVDFGGTVIDMTVKNFALSEDEYKSVAEEIAPFSDANLGL